MNPKTVAPVVESLELVAVEKTSLLLSHLLLARFWHPWDRNGFRVVSVPLHPVLLRKTSRGHGDDRRIKRTLRLFEL